MNAHTLCSSNVRVACTYMSARLLTPKTLFGHIVHVRSSSWNIHCVHILCCSSHSSIMWSAVQYFLTVFQQCLLTHTVIA